MGGGQFSIFGAIEEKIGHGFSPIGRFTANARDESFLRWMGGSFRVEGMARRKSGRVGSRIVHRVCTGNAERQFSVLSSQFSVLSSQLRGSLYAKGWLWNFGLASSSV
jgi:hypothetical protein